MLSAGDPARGKAGYVALERFEGTIDGLHGIVALQQYGSMNDGLTLYYEFVPGSGSEARVRSCRSWSSASPATLGRVLPARAARERDEPDIRGLRGLSVCNRGFRLADVDGLCRHTVN
jgi:hypothetical protein